MLQARCALLDAELKQKTAEATRARDLEARAMIFFRYLQVVGRQKNDPSTRTQSPGDVLEGWAIERLNFAANKRLFLCPVYSQVPTSMISYTLLNDIADTCSTYRFVERSLFPILLCSYAQGYLEKVFFLLRRGCAHGFQSGS